MTGGLNLSDPSRFSISLNCYCEVFQLLSDKSKWQEEHGRLLDDSLFASINQSLGFSAFERKVIIGGGRRGESLCLQAHL
jgi:hypothetical protein